MTKDTSSFAHATALKHRAVVAISFRCLEQPTGKKMTSPRPEAASNAVRQERQIGREPWVDLACSSAVHQQLAAGNVQQILAHIQCLDSNFERPLSPRYIQC
eukprot:TRINITY_DN17310_c0_g1_i1.p1 TRINITY_DN17310_c0_g1~~TRINITY_DN17310_c0_g1_i1.p1  ORF type:complete len:102 (+),score=0.23 TRINITY_DN17310_c0_g1_i1:356-661(+)